MAPAPRRRPSPWPPSLACPATRGGFSFASGGCPTVVSNEEGSTAGSAGWGRKMTGLDGPRTLAENSLIISQTPASLGRASRAVSALRRVSKCRTPREQEVLGKNLQHYFYGCTLTDCLCVLRNSRWRLHPRRSCSPAVGAARPNPGRAFRSTALTKPRCRPPSLPRFPSPLRPPSGPVARRGAPPSPRLLARTPTTRCVTEASPPIGPFP